MPLIELDDPLIRCPPCSRMPSSPGGSSACNCSPRRPLLSPQVPALLEDAFLRRLIDVSTEVRVMAVKETVPLLEQKPALRATLIEHLLPRARDAKDKVREAYVTAVCEAALETALEAPDLATYAPLLEDVAHRMLDTTASSPTCSSRSARRLRQRTRSPRSSSRVTAPLAACCTPRCRPFCSLACPTLS